MVGKVFLSPALALVPETYLASTRIAYRIHHAKDPDRMGAATGNPEELIFEPMHKTRLLIDLPDKFRGIQGTFQQVGKITLQERLNFVL